MRQPNSTVNDQQQDGKRKLGMITPINNTTLRSQNVALVTNEDQAQ
jgi:hypothetical protein